jgi:lipid-A-disaccharide synthase
MKYYIIVGEASGDLHGSNLIRELKKLDNGAEFRVWGGDLMENEGAHLVKHYRDLAFMGFTEVLMNLRTILSNISFCKEDIEKYQPDCLILIDYPGFNLRIAKFAKEQNLKTLYYISPQIWAWKQSRVKQIKEYVDRMYVILPFEKDFYAKFGVDVDFVGHPLLDAIDNHFAKNSKSNIKDYLIEKYQINQKPIIAILPGSRKQEISKMLKIMLSIVGDFKDYQFVIAAAPSIDDDFYLNFTKSQPNVKIIKGETYNILSVASAALVTSGTATLETALFEVPQVVCYSAGKISYLIAKNLIKVKYISLVNLIMDKEIVRELIQDDLNKDLLKLELNALLNGQKRENLINEYKVLKEKLGGSGASKNAADLMMKYLNR